MSNLIREFNQSVDSQAVFQLYQKTIGKNWPLEKEDFFKLINDHFEEGSFLVELGNSEIKGFISAQLMSDKTASIVIFSHIDKNPANDLLSHIIYYLKKKGIKKIQLGGGGYSYFWPGIPKNEPHLIEFFKKNGFKFTETSLDLTQDLSNYKTPLGIENRIVSLNINFQIAKPQDKEKILEFEKEYFPDWSRYYEDRLNIGEFQDILTALDNEENIIGTVLLSDKNSKAKGNFWTWRKLLGEDSGAFGAIGVHPKMRSKGIGLALAGRATDILKERGTKTVYIGWTWLIDWYGKLGYKVWREYEMSWKEI